MKIGFTSLPQRGLLKITGLEAAKFLQGQLTCDLREISNEKSNLGACCTYQGRMISNFRIFYCQDAYFLSMHKSLAEITLNYLKKYIIFSKASVEDASTQCMTLGITIDTNSLIFNKLPLETHACYLENELLIIKVDENRFEIFGGHERIENLKEKYLANKIPLINEQDWDFFDFQIGLAYLRQETSELFTPQMLNLEKLGGVSFTKGCYTGQEVIARTKYLGKVKKQLVLLTTDSKIIPPVNTPLFYENKISENQTAIGSLINVTPHLEGGYAALAVLKENITKATVLWNQGKNQKFQVENVF